MFVDLVGSTALSDPPRSRGPARADRRLPPPRVAGEVDRLERLRRQVHGRRRPGLLRLPAGARGRRRAGGPGRARARGGGAATSRRRPASRCSASGSASRPGWWWSATCSAAAPRGSRRSSARPRTWPRGCRGWPSRTASSSPPARAGSSAACSSAPTSARVEAKGFAEPVRAYRVLGVGAAASRFEAFHAAALAPLVGREEELGLLLRRWEQAKERRGPGGAALGRAGGRQVAAAGGGAGAPRATSRTPACATSARRTARTAPCTRSRPSSSARPGSRAATRRRRGSRSWRRCWRRPRRPRRTWRCWPSCCRSRPATATPRRRSPRSASASGPSRRCCASSSGCRPADAGADGLRGRALDRSQLARAARPRRRARGPAAGPAAGHLPSRSSSRPGPDSLT